MKKTFLVVVSIFLVSTLFAGCGKQSDIDRLARQVDREIERTDEYKQMLDEAEEKNAEQLVTIDYLNAELARRDATIASLEDELEKSSSTSSASTSTTKIYSVYPDDSDSYLAKKFWFDGNNYSSNTTWYSDITCKSESQISDVTIISPIVDTMKQSNGYTVYVCMSSNGLVYSSNYPYLIRINN